MRRVASVVLVVVTLAALGAPAAPGQRAPSAGFFQEIPDFSGFELVGRFMKWPAEKKSLAAICDARRGAILEATEAGKSALAAVDERTDPVKAARVNNSKMLDSISFWIPMPSSRMRMVAVPSSLAAEHQMWPPSGVYLAAFVSRFDTTWTRRVGSPLTHTGSLHGAMSRWCLRSSTSGWAISKGNSRPFSQRPAANISGMARRKTRPFWVRPCHK